MTQTEAFRNNPNISALVNAELANDSRYHPNLGGVTRGGIANHLPMTLSAMQAMGASDQQVTRFIHSWPRHRALIEEHLHLEDGHELNHENWVSYLGRPDKLREFRRVFFGQLSKQNKQQVISEALDKMKFGLPMGLFHPLIRLSFAKMHGDKSLIAGALAYMAIRFINLYPGYQVATENSASTVVKDAKDAKDAKDVWSSINQQLVTFGVAKVFPDFPPGGALRVGERLCGDRTVHKFALTDGFIINAKNLQQRVRQICQAAIQLYLFEPSLTTLHAVTASQALADLTRGVNGLGIDSAVAAQLWQLIWIWLTGLYIEKGYPKVLTEVGDVSEVELTDISWKKLFDAALDTEEVHSMKMTFSCKWLYDQIDANPLYRLAAAKMLGLFNSP